MKFSEAVIAFDRGTDRIEVGPRHDGPGWSNRYDVAVEWRELESPLLKSVSSLLGVLSYFQGVVVSGEVDAQAAHREFILPDTE